MVQDRLLLDSRQSAPESAESIDESIRGYVLTVLHAVGGVVLYFLVAVVLFPLCFIAASLGVVNGLRHSAPAARFVSLNGALPKLSNEKAEK